MKPSVRVLLLTAMAWKWNADAAEFQVCGPAREGVDAAQ